MSDPVTDAARLCAQCTQRTNDRGIPIIRFDRDWLGHDGAGVTVGLIDCALDLHCPDLADADIGVRDFVGFADLSPDNRAHGTGMARLLVGQGRSKMRGVVPRARLYAARVVGPGDTAKPARVAEAIDWLCDLGVDVVAMPIGSDRADPTIGASLARSIAAGVRIFAAAGSGVGNILYPARHLSVVAVGPCDRQGRLSPDARNQPRLDMLAPGIAIVGAAASGSSMATVLAAGAAALGAIVGSAGR